MVTEIKESKKINNGGITNDDDSENLESTHKQGNERASEEFYQKEQKQGIQGFSQTGRIGQVHPGESGRSDEISSESYIERGVGETSVVSGGKSGDFGNRPGLNSTIPHDIVLTPESDVSNLGAASRFDANLSAIRLIRKLDDEDRQATPEEQVILSKYSGFGDSAFEPAFSPYGARDDVWKRRKEELQELVSDEEYRRIERSRLNAFYTTPAIVRMMWEGLEKMGVSKITNPRVLEPSAGSGRFLGLQPADMAARSHRIAVELDPMTGKVLKHLYPDTEVYQMGYEKTPIEPESIDVAISNVPFGDYPVNDPTIPKNKKFLTRSIHNYFFAKTIDNLAPGGVLAFITSHQTMDSTKARRVREEMAEKADLVSAIRLPKGAFPDTQVVTDIIYMRKRKPDEPKGDTSWVDTGTIEVESGEGSWKYTTPVNVNQYFINNPGNVLGEHSTTGTMYRRDEYSVEPTGDLKNIPAQGITKIPSNIITDIEKSSEMERVTPVHSGAGYHEGARVVKEDGIYVKRGRNLEKIDVTGKDSDKLIAILGVRDAGREVLNLQLKDADDQEIKNAQVVLNSVYDKYVGNYGALNSPSNVTLMGDDPDGPFVRALEDWGKSQAKEYKDKALTAAQAGKIKMPIFTQKTVHGLGESEVKSDGDAMIVSLNEKGRVDFQRIGELLGKSPDTVRDELSRDGLVYKNPLGDWESADKYLSGDVREKLRVAEAAASANKDYKSNVIALKEVQPVDLKPSEISVRLGAPWIPATDVSQFARELLDLYDRSWRRSGDEPIFNYIPETGEWIKTTKTEGNYAKLYSEYGTDRIKADEIILKVLNGKNIEINDKIDGETVRNVPATLAAQEKANAIETAFAGWIWKDSDRAVRLAKIYNETFNNYRTRDYNGQHQALPGMSSEWFAQIHPHQKDAIWRMVQDRTTLLQHEVGFGKTAVMVGGGMELRRLGLARKNLYVVPKATHEQFVKQFKDIYPYAKILAPDDADFTPARRSEFISRAVTGDWDAVVLSDSQFNRIPVKPETEAKLLREEVDSFRDAMMAEEQSGGGKGSKTHKQIQKALERLEERLAERQAEIGKHHEHTMYFEDLGVDQLIVDEADMYKNLRFATKMGRLKGLPNTDSQRAWDMYQKIRHLQSLGKNHGVTFATGTSIANTIAEMYTMMRYLQSPMLEAKGISNFDAWAKTFARTTESLEQTPTGAYKMTQRFSQFQNMPELSNMWQQATDIRIADEVPEIVRQRPRLIDDNGKEKRTVISVAPDDTLLNYMSSLAARADNLGNVDPTEDNMLKISNDARMASLDTRMVIPGADPNPNGKIPTAAKNIARIYKETDDQKGTQLVFLDIGTPKSKENVKETPDIAGDNDEYEETRQETEVLRDVYGNLKSHLKASGIPENEIAFVHDAKTKQARLDLWKKVNKGDIRILIGSTGKLGVGVNVQERAAAAHHLDAPWRPRDIEQREGRIIRQGNIVYGPERNEKGEIVSPGKGVRIYTYVTERSFDAYMWQAIEAKSKAIKSIMRRSNPPRAIEDIDSFTMSAGEAKAVATGDPDVLKAVSLKNSVTRLQMLKASHLDSTVRAKEQLNTIPKQIKFNQDAIDYLTVDSKRGAARDKFEITLGNTIHTERAKAGEELKQLIQNTPVTQEGGKPKEIGEYKGFKVSIFNQGADGYKLILTSPDTGHEYVTPPIMEKDITTTGIVQRLENKTTGLTGLLEDTRRDMAKNEAALKTYQDMIDVPFEHAEKLEKMEKELKRLESKLKGEEVGESEYDVSLLDDEPIKGEKPAYRFAEPEPEIIKVEAEKPASTTPIPEKNVPVVAEVIQESKDNQATTETVPDPQVDVTQGVVEVKGGIIANPDNIPAAETLVGEIRDKADAADTELEAVSIDNQADKIEATIPKPEKKRGSRVGQAVKSSVSLTEGMGSTPTPATKEKKPRRVVKVKELTETPTKRELIEAHEQRSERSQRMDEARSHKLTIQPDSPRINRWLRKPGSADVSGIDTKNKIIIRDIGSEKVDIRERRPRLSRNIGRLSPKIPRLSGSGRIEISRRTGRGHITLK